MKRILPFLTLVSLSSTAFAGLTYKVQSSTSGPHSVTIAGIVAVDGPNMRMDVINGDDVLFRANSVILSTDGGKTMAVIDGASRSYYELQLDQILGSSTAALKNMGGMFKISFDNPSVTVRDGGNGEPVEGYPTHKSVLDASYDIAIDAMGQKMTTHMTMTTESWTTDQLSSELTNFLQMRGLRTGIESLDRLIEAQSKGVKGFPLKQVSTVRMNQGGSDVTMTTTALVSNIEKKAIDAAQFAMPAGLTKVDDPLTRMMKQLK